SKEINTTPKPDAVKCPARLKGVPDYTTLFGSPDGCECEPCESVYSPSAYLVDLLAFLEREVEPVEGYFDDGTLAVDNGLLALDSRSYCDGDNHLVSHRPRRPD